ncbi:fibronectin type III domain-containing protein [Paenibacillus sp. N4]|uniref:fibronectin type III domain-containing protein n=1 Tax=Paenibacillus vietnamensis TaxID=2590547 RepID=UPI001CD0E056|nr:fibronectin type III domain-containing protein [Paenibacillus vietnamensis]MCA0757557.1 fibronectin type III domain-containing protein [Paenibacillus vietnamensis]
MPKRSNKLSALLTLMLVLQLLFPAASAMAETNSMLPPSNVTSQFLAPENVKLSWSPVFGASGYNVYSIVDGQILLAGTTSTASYTMNDLPEGSYSYVVSTLGADGESGPGAPIKVDVVYPDMAAPATLTYTIQNGNNIVLNWGTSLYAQEYNLYQIVEGEQQILLQSGTKRTYTMNNAPEGTFTYAVSASNSKYGESPLSTSVQVAVDHPAMSAPSGATFTVTNATDVTLKWNAVNYATNYKVYQLVDGQKVLKSTVTTTTVKYSGLTDGEYFYEIHSYSDRFGESTEGSQVTAVVSKVTMDAPSNLTYKFQNVNDVVLTWGSVPYANSYKIYQIVDGQKVLISTQTGTTVTYTNQPAGEYIYEVYSFSDLFGESAEGSQVVLTVDAVTMSAPSNFIYKIQNLTDIVLSWSTASNANSYKVYQIIDGQKVLKSTVTGTTVTYTNVPAGDYTYEVYSYSNRFGESAEGSKVTLTVDAVVMAAPGNAAYKIQNVNDAVLTWEAAPNATGYKVYQIADGQKILKSTVTGLTVTYTNLPAGDYIYEVYSTSTRYGESQEGSRVSFTMEAVIMDAPVNLAYKVQNGNDILLTWDAAANATNYKIYQKVNGQPVLKSTVTGTSVTFANMPAGEYSYEVHSNSTRYGESPEGGELSFTLTHPTILPPQNVIQSIKNATDFSLNWAAADYATNYRVYQIVNGQKVLKKTVTGTTVSFTGMQPGEYTYTVHTYSSRFGESSDGTELTFTLNGQTMDAPESLTYRLANVNDIVLNWTAVPYATSYKVYQVIDGQKVLKSTVTGLTATYSNMPAGDYFYEVHSVSTYFGESPEGAEVQISVVLPTMAAPGSLAYKVQNGNDIVLSWTAAQYATSYKVYELINGEKVLKNTVSGLTVTFSNVPSGEHTYIVHSINSRFGESPEGSSLSFNLEQWVMEAPEQVTQSISNGNDIKLQWGSVDYASYYNVYQVVDGQKVFKAKSTSLTTTFTNMPEGNYQFVIHSGSTRFGESPEGAKVSFELAFPVMQAPGTLTSTITNGNDLTLKWDTSTYATAYNLYQIIDGQKVLIKTQAATSIKYLNMPEDDYQYIAHAYSNRFGESAEGSPVNFHLTHPTMQAPGNVTQSITNGNDFTLRWGGVTYATAYKVYQVTDNGRVLVKTQTGTSVTFTNMVQDDYKYEVYSFSDRFGESPAFGGVAFTLEWPVVQPPVLAATVFNANNMTFTWQAVPWANEYRLYKVTGATRQLIYNGTALTTKVYNLSESTHEYELTASSNRFGESVSSNRITQEIIYPEMQAPVASLTLLSDTSARIVWNFITYANGYNVYEIIDGKPVLLVKNLNNLSYTVSDLSYANHYYYVTSYSNSFGESTPSNEVEAKLIVDTEPPITSADIPVGWVNQDAVVALSATDNETGVAKSYYSVNDQEMVEGATFTVTQEGINKVTYYSVDRVGNKEEIKTSYVKVDKTAPVTTSSEVNEWSDTATLSLSATDALSGVAKTLYSVNGSEYMEGNSVTVTQEGINEVSYYSVDKAGNTEQVQKMEVKIDRTAPVTTANALSTWVKEDVEVKLNAADAKSGVAKTLYSVNGAEYLEGSSVTVTQEGINEISFYSVDQAGNTEQVQKVEVKIDRTAPVTTSDAPAMWSNKTVTVNLSSADEQSGLAKTLYSLNGAEFVEGTEITVEQEGVNRISYYSVDQASNMEQMQTVDVKIDRTAPVIAMSLNKEFMLDTTIQLNYEAKDNLSGIGSESMTITGPNGTLALTNGTEIKLDKPGMYTVSVKATNAAGLTSTIQKQFVVYIPAKIEVTPNVIKGNNGVFTVRVEIPNEYAGSSIDLETVQLNGVKALNSNNGYYNQAKNGQFKFERSDFNWTNPSVTLEFRGYVNGQLIIGQTTVKVQK